MALASAASLFFLVLISTTSGDICKRDGICKSGDVVKLTCPKVQHLRFQNGYVNFPSFVRESTVQAMSDTITIVFQDRSITDINELFCWTEKEKCLIYKNRTKTEEITMDGSISAIEFSYTVANDDDGFTLKCDTDAAYEFPAGKTAQSQDMTVVDPENLELAVDPIATTTGLKVGEKIDATCKIARNGSGELELALGIEGDAPWGLITIENGNEVSVSTNDSHVARKGDNGKSLECFIKVGGDKWGDAKEKSDPLNVLFAPYGVKSGKEMYHVNKTKGTPTTQAVGCSAMKGNPDTFEWSAIVSENGTITNEAGANTENYSFDVTVEEDNDLKVECIVKNSIGNASHTFEIEIHTPPQISGVEVWVDGTLKDATVDIGDDRKEELTLRCLATPSTAVVKWFKNDNPIATIKESLSRDLTIDVTHKNDKDRYECEATLHDQTATSEVKVLELTYPAEGEITESDIEGGGKKITIEANGNPFNDGLASVYLVVEHLGEVYKEVNGNSPGRYKDKTFVLEIPKDDLNKNYTFILKNANWNQTLLENYKVEALPVIPVPNKNGSGVIAGIIIAVILVVLCVILLVVLWQKGILCAKKPATKTAAVAASTNSTAASTAGALDYAEQGYASADDLNEVPSGGGIINPAGPINGMNGYPPAPQNPDNAPYYTPAIRPTADHAPALQNPDNAPYYTPAIRPTPDHTPTPQNPNNAPYYTPAIRPTPNHMGGGGGGEDEYASIGGETDMENNLQPGVKDVDRLSDDSGVERNGHLPPETGV